MFAVYRTDSDGCTYSSDTILFVTADEQTARDAVALAELEHEEASKIERPTWTVNDIKYRGGEWCMNLLDAYSEKLATIFTVDVPKQPGHKRTYVDSNVSYYYEEVEVR
jgi:hypothetical protein